MHPHGGGGGGGHGGGGGGGHGGGGGGHFGDGSTNTQLFLMIGGWQPSDSTLSTTFGAGFLGCSVICSIIVCGWRLTIILSIISPGGVGFLLTHLLTIGAGVGSLILSHDFLGGDTLQSLHGGGGHPQDIF